MLEILSVGTQTQTPVLGMRFHGMHSTQWVHYTV